MSSQENVEAALPPPANPHHVEQAHYCTLDRFVYRTITAQLTAMWLHAGPTGAVFVASFTYTNGPKVNLYVILLSFSSKQGTLCNLEEPV